MKNILIIFLIVFIGTLSFGADVIVLFGDSTTAKRGPVNIYANHLSRELKEDKVINAGVPGNTTKMARARFEKDVLSRNPSLVVIQFGINDSTVDVHRTPPAKESRVSLEDYEKNLRYFIASLKEKGVKVIVMTPNPLRWTKRLKELYGKPPYKADDPDGFNVTLSKYAAAVRRIARLEKIPLIDVDAEFKSYAKSGENCSVDDLLLDGMHPNNKGHKIVADLLIAEIRKLK